MSGRELFRLLTGDDLLKQPDVEFLVDGLIPRSGLIELYGDRKTGKSFVALDMAGCVAAGVPWHGREVRPGHVVYVALEGKGGLGARYRAWCEAYNLPGPSRFRVLTERLDLRDGDVVARLERTFRLLPEWPALIVVDTLARAMPGGDENSTKDMGQLVAAVDYLRRDGAAMLVHHAGKNGTERGSSSLGAAADLIVRLDRIGKTPALELSCTDAKDFAEWSPIPLRLEATGQSCVILPGSEMAGGESESKAPRRALRGEEAEELILSLLVERAEETDPERIIASGNAAVRELRKDRNTISAAFSRLRKAKRIHKPSDRYVPVFQSAIPPEYHGVDGLPSGAPALEGGIGETAPERGAPSIPTGEPDGRGENGRSADALFDDSPSEQAHSAAGMDPAEIAATAAELGAQTDAETEKAAD